MKDQPAVGLAGLSPVGVRAGNPHPSYRREVNRIPQGNKLIPNMLPRKLRMEDCRQTVPQTTQVDEKSILRCSSEPWSRNSAN